ncbi:MAG: glycosyltransferase [Acidobacteria bacterium]|nr:glycosyltransferase [Acidobacteriota bacterium]
MPRLLIFVVAYHAEHTIDGVLSRIPPSLGDTYDTEILVIDDSSHDRTFEITQAAAGRGAVRFPIRVLFNPVNQGYGGNQKIGYQYAITQKFDYVALLHGDGQYAPECLPDLVRPVHDGSADVCFGSRMLSERSALQGGMPFYKYVGNRILTWCENRVLGAALSEYHSGYRVYAVRALAQVPFDRNTNDFHFDTEIIVQLLRAGLRIAERPIPTYYGDEICRVNGLKYAKDVMIAVLKAKAQDLGIFYEPKFDCAQPAAPVETYHSKVAFESPHTFALRTVGSGTRTLDLGCAGGRVAAAIRANGNYVVGVDQRSPHPDVALDGFHLHDLNAGLPPVDVAAFDCVLLLDVLEHLARPEQFVADLGRACGRRPSTRIIASTGNVAFVVTRLMLLIGQFNYGKRGILDLTHTRLFTFRSFRRLFEQQGFEVRSMTGMPAPVPLAIGSTWIARGLLAVNRLLIRLWRNLFSYQVVLVAQPHPSLDLLLTRAEARGERERVSV